MSGRPDLEIDKTFSVLGGMCLCLSEVHGIAGYVSAEPRNDSDLCAYRSRYL